MNKLKMKSEKIKVQNAKQSEGITLVALIITIIVLLILAMVSIRLVINGGIIDRAERGKDKYSEEEIGEQLKLAYSEWQMENYSDSVDVQAKLRALYGENTKAEIKNGVLKATINGNVYRYNVSTGKTEGYTDPINYGTKTKATIAPGDDITIDTEKFKVFAVSGTEIKAMPYYNLKLDSSPIKQATAETASEAGTSTFSTTNYWTQGDNPINMSDSRNNIQQYINAYKKTLESLGVEEIEVRFHRNGERTAPEYANPSGVGSFWSESSNPGHPEGIMYVNRNLGYYNDYYYYPKGVRPIIIISK